MVIIKKSQKSKSCLFNNILIKNLSFLSSKHIFSLIVKSVFWHREREKKAHNDQMYSPFSVYTVIPWAIIFNVVPALLMMALDALLGASFDNGVKASLTLILFIFNLLYMIYVILIHMRLFYVRCTSKQRRSGLYPITFADLFNMVLASPLIWCWLFLSLYFFDDTMYTDVVNPLNVSGMFYRVYLKFFTYAVHAINGSSTTILPIRILSELAQAISILYYQLLTVIIIGALLSYLLELLDYNTDK